MSVEGTPTAAHYRDLIRQEDEALQRVVGFVREGMRAGRISDTSGELLIAAAERSHAGSVRVLRALLSDRLREEWQA